VVAVGPSLSSLGAQLRWWRRHRGLSQFEAAERAGVSARHLSFLENDRANPSRDVLGRLAAALELPLRAENALLAAAGLAPRHRETPLSDGELARAEAALATIVDNHEPYPAIVMDRLWNIVRANAAMGRLTERLLSPAEQAAAGAPNIMRLTYHPAGLGRFIVNWEETAVAYLHWLHRDIRQTGDAALVALLDEIVEHVPPEGRSPSLDHDGDPYLTIRFAKDDLAATFFTVAATLGTPYDVTLQELRLELFYPADDATAELMARLAAEG
jgi:transcriptional regulator with XRE-family HTH domain